MTDFLSYFHLPSSPYTTQSQGPLPFGLSLRLLLLRFLTSCSLPRMLCPNICVLCPSLPSELDTNVISGRPILSTQLLSEPASVLRTLPPLLLPLPSSSFPTVLISYTPYSLFTYLLPKPVTACLLHQNASTVQAGVFSAPFTDGSP